MTKAKQPQLDEGLFRAFYQFATKSDPSWADGYTEKEAVELAHLAFDHEIAEAKRALDIIRRAKESRK